MNFRRDVVLKALHLLGLFFIFKRIDGIEVDIQEELDMENWLHEYMQRDSSLIIYNRIGKCGSTTMMKLLDQLQDRDQLQSLHLRRMYWGDSGEVLENWLNMTVEVRKNYKAKNATVVLDAHASWVNFTEHGQLQPMYINIVRDPVSRLISMFNYLNSPGAHYHMANARRIARFMGSRKFLPLQHTLLRCLEYTNCTKFVRTEYAEQPMKQFSPMIADEREPSTFPLNEEKLQKTLDLMDKEYLIVLLLEELESGLLLLQCLLPEQFNGALDLYESKDESLKHANANHHKTDPMNDEELAPIRNLVTGTGEVELYNHAVQKFCRTWKLGQNMCNWLPRELPERCQDYYIKKK